MTRQEAIAVRLELEPATDPVRGTLYDERGAAQPFFGWLELASALDAFVLPRQGSPRRDERSGDEPDRT